MPTGWGMGDHRVFVVDFTLSSLVGSAPGRVKRLKSRRLNTKLPATVKKYNECLEANLIRHNVDEDHRAAFYATTKQDATAALDVSEGKSKQFMEHAEKKCRKIRSGRIPFSPDAVIWIKRKQAYESILDFRGGEKCE